jgi:acyl-CoA synthetase (NDP forming)
VVGFELPALSERLAGEIAAMLPMHASTANPVDFAGGGERDVATYLRVARALLASGEVDAVLLTGYFGGYGGEAELLAARDLAGIARQAPVPLVVHTMYADSAITKALRAGGVPVYREIESAARALVALRARAVGAPQPIPRAPDTVPRRVAAVYWGARELVASAGIELVQACRVRTADEARAAASDLGFPVVLKVPGALHKSDAGGVVVGIPDDERLRHALDAMQADLAPDELSVERMAPVQDGVELIVGTRRDARFGPVVLVGLGGVHAEIFDDVAVALAPVEPDVARELILSLRGSALLTGARGRRAAVDLTAAAEATAALSQLGATCRDIDELEINPLLVTPAGAVALDARLIPRHASGCES